MPWWHLWPSLGRGVQDEDETVICSGQEDAYRVIFSGPY